VPIYNEVEIIGEIFREVCCFEQRHPDFNFSFVDDGSTDHTALILLELIRQQESTALRVVSYSPNRGKGFAVRKGIDHGETDLVCFTDGDLAFSLDHLPPLVEALESHDVVLNSRNLAGGKQGNIEITLRVMGRSFNRLARIMPNLPYRDTQAGLKGFRLEAARGIFAKQRIFRFFLRCATALSD
jgi:dolichyl-phosphate beta-glucosyltransferase